MPERLEPGPPVPDMPQEANPESEGDPELTAALRFLAGDQHRYLEQMVDSDSRAVRAGARERFLDASLVRSYLEGRDRDISSGQLKGSWREEMRRSMEQFLQYAEDETNVDTMEKYQRGARAYEQYLSVLTPENLRRYM